MTNHPKTKGIVKQIKQPKLETLPNARINTGKNHSKSSKVAHTFAVICDMLSDL